MNDNLKTQPAELSVYGWGGRNGTQIWNVVAGGVTHPCREPSSIIEEVRKAIAFGYRTISIERQGRPDVSSEPLPVIEPPVSRPIIPLPPEWDTCIPPSILCTKKHQPNSVEWTYPEWNPQWLAGLEKYVRAIVQDEIPRNSS